MILTSENAHKIANSFPLWCLYASGGIWKPYKHIRIVCDRLERLMDPDDPLKRLILEMPPRHGKTYTASTLFPAYYLCHYPDREVQIITNTSDLCDSIGLNAKMMFDVYGRELFGFRVNREARAKAQWKVDGHAGGLKAVGMKGGILGFGAHLLVVDDPYTSLEGGLSAADSEFVWRKFTGTLKSRLNRDNAILVIHQRVAPDDLIGRIKMHDKDGLWECVTFPALPEEDIYIDGKLFLEAGEPLCPEQVSLEQLLEHRDGGMDEAEWQCFWQQNPDVQHSGAAWPADCFDEEIFIDEGSEVYPDRVDHLVIGIDPSQCRGDSPSDYQAIVALGTKGDSLFYVWARAVKCHMNQLAEEVSNFILTELPRIPDAVGIEDEVFQMLLEKPMSESFKRNKIWTSIYGIPTGKVKKEIRIKSLGHFIVNRRMRWVRSPGTQLMASQFKQFPGSKRTHDDLPDALEKAFELLRLSGAN